MLLGLATVGRGHRRYINGSRIGIDDRRASDAEGIHIPAGEARERDRISKLSHPNLGTRRCFERQNHVLFGRYNESGLTPRAIPRVERLSVNRPWEGSVERLVAVN